MNGASENQVVKRCLLGLLIMLGMGSIGRTGGQDMPAISGQRSYGFPTGQRPAFLLPAITSHSKPIALIAVPAEEAWQLAVAAPIAARIRRHDKVPILLATEMEGSAAQAKFVKQLAPALGSCTILSGDLDGLSSQLQRRCAIHVLPRVSGYAETGLLLAMRFWQSTDSVVIGVVEDCEASILGSALASHLGVPFIPVSGWEDARVISGGLEALNVKRLVLVTSGDDFDTISACFPDWNTEVLNTNAVRRRLVEAIGIWNIRNIILSRVPEWNTDRDGVSWLTPYLSLMRGAAVVLCPSSHPFEAETEVSRLIETYSLSPRTATILADYESIGMIAATYGEEPNEYEVLIEPCSRPAQGRAADIGVGRIPCRQVWAASALIARGIAGDYIPGRAVPKVLMIANPGEGTGSLPLCETVSRATAREFKNFRIHTDEFYGVPCHDQTVRRLAGGSQLIIFEGHISEFSLFENPSIYPDDESLYSEAYENDRANDFVEVAEQIPDPSSVGSPEDDDPGDTDSYEAETEDGRQDVQSPHEQTYPSWGTREIHDQEVFDRLFPPMDPCELEGVPLLILQSCHSLDDSASRILTFGTMGILGSATNIHSSSGSALVKAFCDGLLYRGETMGEALRDAQNYLLCVSALKTARGHKQQAKVLRVAYGFHLWGDPESRMFHGLTRSPRLKPVSAEFAGPDKVRIVVPNRRLPTSRTREYFLRMYPGSEVAGIVKRLKDKDIRRITPIYFFRLPMPKGAGPLQYSGIQELNDTTARAVFLADSFKRFLYVLYFPQKEEPGQNFTLRFVE